LLTVSGTADHHYLLPVLVPHELADETAKAFFSTTAEWCALLIGIAMEAFAFWIDAHRTARDHCSRS